VTSMKTILIIFVRFSFILFSSSAIIKKKVTFALTTNINRL